MTGLAAGSACAGRGFPQRRDCLGLRRCSVCVVGASPRCGGAERAADEVPTQRRAAAVWRRRAFCRFGGWDARAAAMSRAQLLTAKLHWNLVWSQASAHMQFGVGPGIVLTTPKSGLVANPYVIASWCLPSPIITGLESGLVAILFVFAFPCAPTSYCTTIWFGRKS